METLVFSGKSSEETDKITHSEFQFSDDEDVEFEDSKEEAHELENLDKLTPSRQTFEEKLKAAKNRNKRVLGSPLETGTISKKGKPEVSKPKSKNL